MAKCAGQCRNQGVCMNGHCECSGGYSGKYCERAPGRASALPWSVLLWIIVLFIVIVIMVYVIIRFRPKPNLDPPPHAGRDPNRTDTPPGGYGNQA